VVIVGKRRRDFLMQNRKANRKIDSQASDCLAALIIDTPEIISGDK
jgi:hypothetical protein